MPSVHASIIAFGVVIAGAIILLCVSLATVHWLTVHIGTSTINFGLFKFCVSGHCFTYEEVTTYGFTNLRIVQAQIIVSVILKFVTMIVMGHLVFISKMVVYSKTHGYAALCIAIVGAILALSGVGRFTTETHDLDRLQADWEYSYSFYLAIVAGVLGLIAGILAIYGVSQVVMSPPGVVVNSQGATTISTVNVPPNNVYPMAPPVVYPQNPYPQGVYPPPETPQKPPAY